MLRTTREGATSTSRSTSTASAAPLDDAPAARPAIRPAIRLAPFPGTLREDVVQIKNEVEKDADAPFTNNPINMNNTGWLLADVFGDCRNQNIRFDVVDLTNGSVVSTEYPACNGIKEVISSPANEGLRIVSADGTFALGFARLGTATQLDYHIRCKVNCNPANQKLVINYDQFHNITSTSWAAETIYYVLGSPRDVFTRLSPHHPPRSRERAA